MKIDYQNMRYRRQATQIVEYFNSVADKVANSSRDFKLEFRTPEIMNYNLLTVSFSRDRKTFYAFYGRGSDVWFQFQDKFDYGNVTSMYDVKYTVFDTYRGDEMMPDIMNNWSKIKSAIERCISEQKSFDNFQI